MTKFVALIVGLLLASGTATAQNSQGVVRSEEGRWIAELITVAEDGWPEILLRKTFPTKFEADTQQSLWEQDASLNLISEIKPKPKMASGSLWPTTQAWSSEWEIEYGKWIEKEVDANFFVRNNIATDCADVAYSLRWIFSRIHGLPAAARLGSSGVVLTNETVRSQWSRLPTHLEWNKDKRFLAAINYLMGLTYTHTLWDDSFPVALTKEALLSGSYHLSLRDESGHTQLVRWLDSAAGVPFLTLNSTVPRQVRVLMESMLYAPYPKIKEGALLRFRWAVKGSSGITLKKAVEMPGYSLEQYSFRSEKDFTFALFEKLGFSGGEEAIREYLYKDILGLFQARVGIVQEGFEKCQKMDCRPGSAGWEDWGTPSRDARTQGKINTLLSAFRLQGGPGPAIENQEVIALEGVSWNLKSLLWNWRHGVFSSDPNVSIVERWGAGGTSWVALQKEFFRSKISERKFFLEKSRGLCEKKDCAFPGSVWQQTSSNVLDVEIYNRGVYVSGEQHLPRSVYQDFKKEKAFVLAQIDGTDITLGHVLKNRSALNSSATASVHEQWGLNKEPAVLSFDDYLIIPYFENWFLTRGATLKLSERSSGKEVALPYRIHRAFISSPVLVVSEGADVFFLNIVNGMKRALPSQLATIPMTQIHTFEQQNFLVKAATGFQIWRLNEVDLSASFVQDLSGVDWKIKGEFLQNESGDALDLATLHFHSKLNIGSVRGLNKDYLFYLSMADLKLTLLSRVSGNRSALDFAPTDFYLAASEKHEFFVSSPSGTQRYTWDKDLKISAAGKFDGNCYGGGKDVLTCHSENRVSVYIFNGQDWILAASGPDVISANEFYLLKRVGNLGQIVDRKTNKVIMSVTAGVLLKDHLLLVAIAGSPFLHLIDGRVPNKILFSNMFEGWSSVEHKDADVFMRPMKYEGRYTLVLKAGVL